MRLTLDGSDSRRQSRHDFGESATVITVSDKRLPTPGLDLEHAIGLRVRAFREARGMSQAQLGEALGAFGFPMGQPTIYKLENGARPLRVNELAALAGVFRIPVVHLLGSGAEGEELLMQRYAELVETQTHLRQQLEMLVVQKRDIEARAQVAERELEGVQAALKHTTLDFEATQLQVYRTAQQLFATRSPAPDEADYYADQESDRMRGKD